MVSLILKKHDIIPFKTYYGVESTNPLFNSFVPATVRRSFLGLSL